MAPRGAHHRPPPSAHVAGDALGVLVVAPIFLTWHEVALEPARQRCGWYIDRTAFGPDLYREGRGARLHLAGGGAVTAQAHLEACWEIAREALDGMASPEDLDAVDRMVGVTSRSPAKTPAGSRSGRATPSRPAPTPASTTAARWAVGRVRSRSSP